MNSKFVFIGLACAGVFANVFIALAGNGLDASSAKLFGNFADIAIGLAVVFLFASQKCSAEEREERDAIYRDFDAVYRYVDDTVREVKDDVRACQRGSESCCTMTKKRS